MMTPGQKRLREEWRRLAETARPEALRADPRLRWVWPLWARDNQLPPEGEWAIWLLLAGRGFGKTRCGAEWVRAMVRGRRAGRIALVGPTAADTRDVMVEGESGLLAVFPPRQRPLYEPSKRKVTFRSGAIAMLYSAEEPDRLRGPQHDAGWSDEVAAWKYPEAWDMLQLGMRLGARPRQVVTTTPKPNRLLKGILADPAVVVTRGSTFENAANLAAPFLAAVRAKYEGTRLGRQELGAELLEDNPNALWRRDFIDPQRRRAGEVPPLRRVVVALDPAASHGPASDETGIVVAGLGEDGRGYVLADVSCRDSPAGWAAVALRAYRDWRADRIVAEVNQGGEMVEAVLRSLDAQVSYQGVHASRGKVSRAEPVAALYEQGRVSHVGALAALEDQLCDYDPRRAGASPDRMDALVWALTALMLDSGSFGLFDFMAAQAAAQNKAKP